jgi:hypothetical protein
MRLQLSARTPAEHNPGSLRPSQIGTAGSKDVWMLGIGLGLMVGGRKRRGRSG